MSWIAEIREFIKLVAFNKKVAIVTVLALSLLSCAGYFWFKNIYSKPEQNDCEFVKQQNRELLDFILEARKEVEKIQVAQPTSFILNEWKFQLARHDTVPGKTQQQKKAILLSKFDSVLLKARQDSINRLKKKS